MHWIVILTWHKFTVYMMEQPTFYHFAVIVREIVLLTERAIIFEMK